jgi:redox-sensitive bicupin YhaK (pirin superfamily)
MNRKDFLKTSALAPALLAASTAIGNMFKGITGISAYRGVEGVFAPTNTHMVGNGFKVMNFFPGGKGFEERMSPFFLLDFNAEVNFPPSKISQGVGVHPHRGIETITFAYKGAVAHHDSAGNSGVINPGDVQWMTAGGGVLHKEYHEKNFNEKGGAFEMVQLWINLPAKHKMVPARYQAIKHGHKGTVKLEKNAGEVHVIAGEFRGVKGPAQVYSPVHIYDIHLNAGGEIQFSLPANFNTAFVVIDGEVKLNHQHKVPHNHYAQLANSAGEIHIKANEKTVILLLSGEPLNEPYVSYGPFVMNTEAEIKQAIQDYNEGKFGFLAD